MSELNFINESKDTLLQKAEIKQTAEKFLEASKEAQIGEAYQQSIELAEEAIPLFQQLEEEDTIIEIKSGICQSYVMLNRLEEGLAALKDLERKCKEKYGYFHKLTVRVLHQLTYLHLGVLRKMEEGIAYALQCLEINLNMELEDPSQLAVSYNNLGYAYGEIRDYDRQLLYYQKALSIVLETVGEEDEDAGRAYNNLGFYYQEVKEDYPTAIQYYQKSIEIHQKIFGNQHHTTALGYFNLAKICQRTKDYSNALRYGKKSLSIWEHLFGKNHIAVSRVKVGLGECYLLLELPVKTIKEYSEALQVLDDVIEGRHPERAILLNNWSVVLTKLGEYRLALEKNHLALLEMLKGNHESTDFFHIPYQIEDFNTIFPLLRIFIEKARICLHYFDKQSPDQKYLELCLDTCLLGNQYIEHQRTGYQTTGAKMVLNKNATDVYVYGVQSGVKMTTHPKGRQIAFTFSEQAKANLLLSSIHDSLAKVNSSIPPTLLQEEKDLQVELTRLDKNIQQQTAAGDKKDKKYLQKLQNQFFDYHQAYLQLIEKFEKEYPDYYQLKYETETVSIEEVQENLSDNQMMVSYFVGETHYYIFFIAPDFFEVLGYEKRHVS